MRENRTQCVAIMLSKVRRLLTRPRDGKPQKSVYDCLDVFEKAEAPYVQLSEEEIAAQFWGASAENFEKSIVCGLLRAMGHMSANAMPPDSFDGRAPLKASPKRFALVR